MDSMSKLQARVEDRLSALPDEVICHILSFLGTNCAVRTTILSKRWNNKWTLVPNLDFEEEEFYRLVHFERFVNWVLDFRGSSNIQKLKLECSHDIDFEWESYIEKFNAERRRDRYQSRIWRWIDTAIGRNLVELNLNIEFFPDQNDFGLPRSLFESITLEVLKLGSNFIIGHLPMPRNYFPQMFQFTILASIQWNRGCLLPTFEYLNHLKLHLRDCNYGRLLTESLQKFPNLECLDIDYWFLSHEELSLPEFVPFCLLSHLKTIPIRGFEGCQVEMKAAKYLLRNGRVLDKMTIYTRFQYGKEKLLYKEFLMFQRGSVNCQVEFVRVVCSKVLQAPSFADRR